MNCEETIRDALTYRDDSQESQHEAIEALDSMAALVEAGRRLAEEVLYFDGHLPEECAMVRWAQHVDRLIREHAGPLSVDA